MVAAVGDLLIDVDASAISSKTLSRLVLVTARPFDSWFSVLLSCGCLSNRCFCSSSTTFSLTCLAVSVLEKN